MLVEVLVVHPNVTIVKTETDPRAGDVTQQREVPTNWWPMPPQVGQRWDLNFAPMKTSADQYVALNEYLRRG